MGKVVVPPSRRVVNGVVVHVEGYVYDKRTGKKVSLDKVAPATVRKYPRIDRPDSKGPADKDSTDRSPKPESKDRGSTDAKKPEGIQGGKGTKADPYKVRDVETAAKLLGEKKYVELDHERKVSTLLDKLAGIVAEAREKGEKAPTYDLCKVTVPGTNLFCVESKGIPRIQMPQLMGKPAAGSKANEFPKDKDGLVNLSAEFAKYLKSEKGVSVKESEIDARFLKASQNELNGAKVAGINQAVNAGQFDLTGGQRIWVSNDDYVIDGHHRWAAAVADEIEKSGQSPDLPVQVVDMDIITILDLANKWTREMGLAGQGV